MNETSRVALSFLLIILEAAVLLGGASVALFSPSARGQSYTERRMEKLEDAKDKTEGRLSDIEAAVKMMVKSNEDHSKSEDRNSNLLYAICTGMILFAMKELFTLISGKPKNEGS